MPGIRSAAGGPREQATTNHRDVINLGGGRDRSTAPAAGTDLWRGGKDLILSGSGNDRAFACRGDVRLGQERVTLQASTGEWWVGTATTSCTAGRRRRTA
jgi:hypothetical protein